MIKQLSISSPIINLVGLFFMSKISRDSMSLFIITLLVALIAVLLGLIAYTLLLRVSSDYYRPMSNEQIREQKILRGLYKLPKGDGKTSK